MLDTVNAVHNKTATKKQIVKCFINNATINNMCLRGIISDEVYQSNQHLFQQINDSLAREAVEKAGLIYTKQVKPNNIAFHPGTDTDIIVRSNKRKITLKKIKQVVGYYNNGVNCFLNKSGYREDTQKNWSKITDTDFLPHPFDTRYFKAISKWLNKTGGTAYEYAEAAEVESYIRSGKYDISINKAFYYNIEMNNQVRNKLKRLAQIEKKINNLKNSNQKYIVNRKHYKYQNLLAEEQKISHQISKYLNRKDDIIKIIAKNYNINVTYKLSDEIIQAQTRSAANFGLAKKASRNATLILNELDSVFINLIMKIIYKKTFYFIPQNKIFL